MAVPNDYHGSPLVAGTTYFLTGSAQFLDATGVTGSVLIGGVPFHAATAQAFKATRVLDAAVGTTKGDILVHNGTTWVRLPVGSNGQVLSADSAQASGVKWLTGGGGGGVTDHGALTGLSDDDHAQYVIGDGSRASTRVLLQGITDETQLEVWSWDSSQTAPPFVIKENGGSPVFSVDIYGNVTGYGATFSDTVNGTAASFSGTVSCAAPASGGHAANKTYVDTVDAAIISILTAPTYVTISNDPYLANERALTAGVGLTLTDAGAGGSVTLTAKAVQTAGAAFGDAVNTASVAAGTTCYVRVPYAGAIAEWHIVASGSCSATIDIWKAAGALPTVANTITASAKPALSSQATASSSTLTGWTTSVAVGDVLAFHLEALTGSVNSIAISLKIQP